MLSGNKGRVLRASNSMATWKPCAARTTAPQARRPPTHRRDRPLHVTVPVELCIGFTQTTHDDRRRRVRGVLGDGPSARKINVSALPMIPDRSTCVI